MGEIVVLLYEPSPVYDYEEGLWAVLEGGTFIGVVGEGRQLSFPAIDPALGAADLTIADLEESEPLVPLRPPPLTACYSAPIDRCTDQGRVQPT